LNASVVAITLIASGGVDDYTADDRATLVTKVASLADAQHAAVALRIEAASVQLAFFICTTGTAAAVAMVDRLNASLPNATVASAKLGVSDAFLLDIRILDDAFLCSLEPDGYHALQPSPPPFMPPAPPSPPPSPPPPSPPPSPPPPSPPPGWFELDRDDTGVGITSMDPGGGHGELIGTACAPY